MFQIPLEDRVKPNEEFIIAAMGHGVASLCGQQKVYKVASKGLSLGQRFRATNTCELIPVTFVPGELPKPVKLIANKVQVPKFKTKKKR